MSKPTFSTSEFRPEALDGVLALRSMLVAGLNVSVYPRQVLISDATDEQPELSFIHGVPGSTGLAPVTYAQDKRMRRSLMEKNGIPIPKGATFTLGRGVALAEKFAKRIGFPVSVKPAIGDNGIETFLDLGTEAELHKALDYLRQPTTERSGFTRAAYGLTELREPGIENGKVTVPPGYMFLIEKQHPGSYMRFLVNEGRLISAVVCDGYPSDGSLVGGKEVVNDIHAELKELAEHAAMVIPGNAVVALDAIVPDPLGAPGPELVFTEYSERPGLWVQGIVRNELPYDLSAEILRSYAQRKGFRVREVSNEALSLDFEAYAIPDAAQAAEAMTAAATSRGFSLSVSQVDQVEGTAFGKLVGNSLVIAKFVDDLLEGKVDDVPVMLIKLQHH